MNGQSKGRCGGRRKLHVPIHNIWRQCIVVHIGECLLWVQIGDRPCTDRGYTIKSTIKYYTKGDTQLIKEIMKDNWKLYNENRVQN